MKKSNSGVLHFNLTNLFIGMLMSVFLINLSFAADSGSAIKDDNLRAEPFSDAKTVTTIKRGERLEIIKKQGVWLQVKAKKNTGWLRLLAVKRDQAAGSVAANASILKQASGRAGTGQIVSTTGIRGLSEQELKAATFNAPEISTLESYTLNAAEGKKFADTGQLKTVSFASLTAAKAISTNGSAK